MWGYGGAPQVLGLDSSPKKSLQNGEHMCFCLWEIPMKISGLVSQKFEMQPIDTSVNVSLRWRFATKRNERSKMEWIFLLVKDPWNSYEQGHHSPCCRGCYVSIMLTLADVNRENVLQGCFTLLALIWINLSEVKLPEHKSSHLYISTYIYIYIYMIIYIYSKGMPLR